MLDGAFEHGYSLLCNLYASAKLRKEMEEARLKKDGTIAALLREQADRDRQLNQQSMDTILKMFKEESERKQKELDRLQRELDELNNKSGGCVIL